VSAKGDQIAMGDLNGVVSVANFPSGEDRRELTTLRRNPLAPTMTMMTEAHGPVTALTWRDDGYFFASGHADGTVVVWSTQVHLQTMRHSHAELKKPHPGPVTGIAFTPDARTIVSQSMGIFDNLKNKLQDGSVFVWTAATGEVLSEWTPHSTAPFLPAESRTFGVDSALDLLGALPHTPGRFHPAFGAQERLVLTTGERGVEVWDSLSGEQLGERLRTSAPVSAVAASAKGNTLACVSGDTIFLTSLDHRSATEVCSTERILYSMTMSSNGALVAALSESKDGRGLIYEGGVVIYSRSLDRELRVWEAAGGRELLTRDVFPPNGIWFNREGSVVGHGVDRFNSRSGEPVAALSPPGSDQPTIHPSPDGTTGVASPRDGSGKGGLLGTVDLLTGKVTPWAKPPEGVVKLVAISADNQLSALTLNGGRIELREVAGGASRWAFTASLADSTALAISRDGRMIAVGAMNHVIEVWDTQTQSLRHRLVGHRREISSLSFSPDSTQLASASGLAQMDNPAAGEVRLWDLATGELRIEFPADLHAIYPSVAISPDGDRVYAIACDPRAQPVEVLVLMSPGGQRLLPTSMPEAPTTSRILYWDASAKHP
jgi:WD40 repeat protein